jgi:hypothetical protein
LVERDLAKVEVASSNLVSRSNKKDVAEKQRLFCFCFVEPTFAPKVKKYQTPEFESLLITTCKGQKA